VDVGEFLTEAGLGGDPAALALQPFAELGHQRRGACLSRRQALSRSHAADLGLDPVELGDPAQPLGGDLRSITVEDFLQLPAGMCPAVRNRDRRAARARGARQPIVAGIAVQLQDAVEALQDLLRVHAGAARAVSKDHAGRVIAAPAPIISGQRPEEASLRPASAGLQNRRRRFVHEELARALQVLGEPVDHRGKVEGRRADPIGERAALKVDPGTREDLALAIERQMVGELGDEHMRNRALGRQPTLDQEGRGWRLGDPFGAGTAGILGSNRHEDAELGRHDVQPLAAVLADPVHRAAAAGTLQAGRLDHLLDPGEALRQIAPIATGDLGSPRTGRGRGVFILLGLCLGDGSFQIFEGQLPLVLTQFLGPFAMHDLVQLGDEVLEAFVGFPECIALAQHGQNSVTLVFRNGRQVEGWGAGHGGIILRSCLRRAGFSRPESLCHSGGARLQRPHSPPVQPGEQRFELGAVQGHRTIPDRGPGEGALLQPFVGHDETAAVPEQDLHPICALRSEDEDRPGERIFGQGRLHQGCQAIMPLAEVYRLRRHQDADPLGRHQHVGASRARTIAAIRSADVSGDSSIRVVPLTIRITCWGFASEGSGVSVGSQMTRGAKAGSPSSAAGRTSCPCFARRRQAESWFGRMPY